MAIGKKKKASKKMLKRIGNEKMKNALLEREPERSYNRKIVHTEMPWPLEVIAMGRKDIIFFILLMFGIIAAAAIYGLWILAQFIMEAL